MPARVAPLTAPPADGVALHSTTNSLWARPLPGAGPAKKSAASAPALSETAAGVTATVAASEGAHATSTVPPPAGGAGRATEKGAGGSPSDTRSRTGARPGLAGCARGAAEIKSHPLAAAAGASATGAAASASPKAPTAATVTLAPARGAPSGSANTTVTLEAARGGSTVTVALSAGQATV